MSQINLKVLEFQDRTGINPATGERALRLIAMSKHAYDLIEILAVEQAGIRDGDGHWYGGDPIHGTIHQLVELEREDKRLDGLERGRLEGVTLLDAG